jgi:hypothetical protein
VARSTVGAVLFCALLAAAFPATIAAQDICGTASAVLAAR